MGFITTVFYIGGHILLKAIVLFLMAIPSGMGLGVGLHAVKSLFKRKERKTSKTSRIDVDMETALASSKL